MCQTERSNARQVVSALFSGLNAADCSKQKLDNAVFLVLAHADQLRCSSDNDPESRVAKDFLEVHGVQDFV